jgi:signal transduction histidine kinase
MMHNSQPPIPDNETERLLALANLDLDYSSMEDNFSDLTLLAAKVAGTEISLINLIDSYTQWTVAHHGLQVEQTPRENTACQYTIMNEGNFEILDLSADARFKDKEFVCGPPGLRYYFGLPLKTNEGVPIGALCVLDSSQKTMGPEKVELLEIIAKTVVKRLQSYEAINGLSVRLSASNESRMNVAHDIRGPLAGIVGLADIIAEQGETSDVKELLELVAMISRSSKATLELADEILSVEQHKPLAPHEFNLRLFKDKLIQLYAPQAKYKNITLVIKIDSLNEQVSFFKNKLLQITGNLISNALKFTDEGGTVAVNLDLSVSAGKNMLKIIVSDNGMGIEAAELARIVAGVDDSRTGTFGEKGFGFGLSLVSHLVDSLNGHMDVVSTPGQGSRFEISLPQN